MNLTLGSVVPLAMFSEMQQSLSHASLLKMSTTNFAELYVVLHFENKSKQYISTKGTSPYEASNA